MNPGWRKQYTRYKSLMKSVVSRYKDKPGVKAYLEILLSLATVSVFSIFALRPTLLTIAGLIKEIEAKKQTVEKLDGKIENITRSQILLDQERDRIELLEHALPKNQNSKDFIRQVEGLSSTSDLAITNLTLDPVVIKGKDPNPQSAQGQEQNFNSFEFSISARGNYQNMVDFLEDLEKLRRASRVTVSNIAIEVTREDRILKFNVSGLVLYAKELQIST